MELFAFYVEKLTLLTMLAIPQIVAILYITARVAELVDAVDLKSIDPRSCRFEPGREYHLNNALVAQRLEQGSHKPLAVGSIPTGRTIWNNDIIKV